MSIFTSTGRKNRKNELFPLFVKLFKTRTPATAIFGKNQYSLRLTAKETFKSSPPRAPISHTPYHHPFLLMADFYSLSIDNGTNKSVLINLVKVSTNNCTGEPSIHLGKRGRRGREKGFNLQLSSKQRNSSHKPMKIIPLPLKCRKYHFHST